MRLTRLLHILALLFSSGVFLFGCAHSPVSVHESALVTPPETQPALADAPADEAEPDPLAAAAEPADVVSGETATSPQSDNASLQGKKESNDDDETLLDTALELTETAQEYWADGDVDQAVESLATIQSLPNRRKTSGS